MNVLASISRRTCGKLVVVLAISVLLGCSGRIARIEQGVNELQDQVSVFRKDLERQNSRLERTFDELNSVLDEARTTDADLIAEMKALEDQLAELRGATEQVSHRLDRLGSSVPSSGRRAQSSSAGSVEMDSQGISSQRLAPLPNRSPDDSQRTGDGPDAESNSSTTSADDGTSSPDLQPDQMYRTAYEDYVRGQYRLAIIGFQNFVNQYPDHHLSPNAQYWIGESYYSLQQYDNAQDGFEKVVSNHPDSKKVPDALLKAGYSAFEAGRNSEAREILRDLLDQYPDSHAAVLARQKMQAMGS